MSEEKIFGTMMLGALAIFLLWMGWRGVSKKYLPNIKTGPFQSYFAGRLFLVSGFSMLILAFASLFELDIIAIVFAFIAFGAALLAVVSTYDF